MNVKLKKNRQKNPLKIKDRNFFVRAPQLPELTPQASLRAQSLVPLSLSSLLWLLLSRTCEQNKGGEHVCPPMEHNHKVGDRRASLGCSPLSQEQMG